MSLIQTDSVATFDYSLHTQAGDLIDKACEYVYLHGHSKLLPGMVKALEGKSIGDQIQIELEPASTFGERLNVESLEVHKSELGPQFDRLQPGMAINGQDEYGEITTFFVINKIGAYAILSQNHPLAGTPLIFEAKIIDVRDALPEEIDSRKAFGRNGDNKPTSCACC